MVQKSYKVRHGQIIPVHFFKLLKYSKEITHLKDGHKFQFKDGPHLIWQSKFKVSLMKGCMFYMLGLSICLLDQYMRYLTCSGHIRRLEDI